MFRNVIFFLGIALLMGCGTGIKQTVTLHDRPGVGTDTTQRPMAHGKQPNTVHNGEPSVVFGNDVLKLPSGVGGSMDFLASDKLMGRRTGTKGIEEAATFITRIFREAGIQPYFTDYRDSLSTLDSISAYNVVGWIPGKDPTFRDEYVLIGAHYDHIGTAKAVEGDSIANGANDNASGTVAVRELAKRLAQRPNPKRSIIFALFSAEEEGLLGSKHLAKKLKDRDMDLYTMLNFEMVGVPMYDRGYLLYLTGYQNSNLADVINRYAGEQLVGFLPSAQNFNLFKRSDNYPFFLEFGVPCQTFSSFDFTNFDHYHGVGDEASLMDVSHMELVIEKLGPVIEQIVNSSRREIINY
ncbi:MAG: M20/M25/M40 family metallo-hydrolase [Flavobacteriaceae bacterium]